jgi:chemotaxis protein methyltransferase CheR
VSMCLSTTDYEQVFDVIRARTGLRVQNGRVEDAARAVDDVLASESMTGIDDLLLALNGSLFTETLWQRLIQTITVGETYFFRDESQFDGLRTHILPQLIAERLKTGNRQLRLWSAGCASGEEPYSLAMLLHEIVPNIETWNISILGTDINSAFLKRARYGLYRAASFRGETPDYIRDRWFTVTDDSFQLDRAIREMVAFLPLNLASNTYPLSESFTLNMDLIVCRNVTIYFDDTRVREIVGRFHQALNDGGSLMVGHSELSTTLYREFSIRNFEKVIFYQKTAPPAPPLRAPNRLIPVTAPRPPVPEPPAEDEPLDLEAVWKRAKQAADREQWEEALAVLDRVERAHLFRPEFHYLRGLVQMAAGNGDDALWAWRQALYCDPTFALAHYSLGELFAQLGDTRRAVGHWHQARAAVAALDPQHHLLFADDVTVEMLQGLLAARFSLLTGSNGSEPL